MKVLRKEKLRKSIFCKRNLYVHKRCYLALYPDHTTRFLSIKFKILHEFFNLTIPAGSTKIWWALWLVESDFTLP